MTTYLRARFDVFYRYRHLLKNLVNRDIKVKYRRSVLGIAWSVLNPLFMMLIMTAVFSYLFRFEIAYFPVYLLCGQTTFNFFSEATNLAMDSILGNNALIKKVYVPKYIFPLEKVLFSCINTLFSLIPLFAVTLIMQVPITPWAILFPIPILLLAVFNFGVGTLLASLVIFFRDIKHLYGVIVLALTYLTPIFYPIDILPSWMLTVVRLNPIYWYVAMVRQVLLYGQAPTLWQWVITIGCAVVAVILGLLVLKKTQDRFILYI